jgi:hypothetical protein
MPRGGLLRKLLRAKAAATAGDMGLADLAGG